MTVAVLDLHRDDERGEHTAAFLVDGDEPALVDCGAGATLPALEAGLRAHGAALEELRHLLLTHIHLDHAGAAGTIAARCPRLVVWVHAAGARHLIDPSRLLASARRVFGSELERLFGEMVPIPAGRLRLLDAPTPLAGPPLAEAFPTPGHARHHLAFTGLDGTVFAGDVGGAGHLNARYLMPEAPPPDVDVPAWVASIDAIMARRPARLAVSHFGVVDDPLPLLADLRTRLATWSAWAAGDRDAFLARTRAEIEAAVPAAAARAYLAAGSLPHTYDGLRRYGEIAASSA
jgi:glyoxylase-like metal-dependent hydrolase (beta-lactamase superfamily II)